MQNLTVLPLGGCLLHQPLVAVGAKREVKVRARLGIRGGTPLTHTLGELIQLIGVLRHEVTLPPGVKRLAGLPAAFQPLPGIGDLRNVDVVLVEPNTPVEIVYDSFALQRNAIINSILVPIRSANPGPEVAKMTAHWLVRGMMREDDSARRLGVDLAKLVPDSMPLADIARDVLVHARGDRRDVMTGLRHLRSILERPMAVLTYTPHYMPDGRPVSWPAGFREDMLSAAAELRLPVMEPWKLVEKHGVAMALIDYGHYTDELNLIVGRKILKFATRSCRAAARHERGQMREAAL